jgi:hypothetical protein
MTSKPPLIELRTVDEIIDSLGGTTDAMRIAQVEATQVVSNWRARGRFPSDKYHVMITALREKGFTADPALWNQVIPAGHSHENESAAAPAQ